MGFSEHLVTDDLTILLGIAAATVFILHALYKPQPLVHPILLGRQSDVARVRYPGESAVYRNYSTGLMGRLPAKPSNDVRLLSDFVKTESDTPRTLWSTKIANPQLARRVTAFGSGLIRFAGLASNESNVLLLLNDGIEFFVADLALAAHAIPSFTLSSPHLLTPILESHPPSAIITSSEFLPHLIELIYDTAEHGHHTIIVVGEPDLKAVGNSKGHVKFLRFSDLEREGAKIEPFADATPNPHDVFTVSFFESESGQLEGAQLTHENLTAGVAAIRALLPLSSAALSPSDTIVSSHSLGTAFGRAVAYAAILEGTNFATLDSTKLFRIDEKMPEHDAADALSASSFLIPPPTVLFIKPGHLHALTTSILKQAHRSFILHPFAWRHKVAGIREGFIGKDSLWDRLLLNQARANIVGESAGTIRGIVVSGSAMDMSSVEPSRIAFSIPIVNAHIHPLVAAPIFASHPFDLQTFPSEKDNFGRLAFVGPPSINVEVKLVGVDDEAIESGKDPIGVLLVRGPPVGKVLDVRDEVVGGDDEGWAGTGERARVHTNGVFKVLPTEKA